MGLDYMLQVIIEAARRQELWGAQWLLGTLQELSFR